MRALTISAAVLAALLTGCGGSSDSKDATSEPSPSTATTSAATVGILDACPAIESALPSAGEESVGQWSAFLARIDDLSESGDEETRNALALLRPGAEAMESLMAGSDDLPLDVNISLRESVQSFADRCKAAGSSALQ